LVILVYLVFFKQQAKSHYLLRVVATEMANPLFRGKVYRVVITAKAEGLFCCERVGDRVCLLTGATAKLIRDVALRALCPNSLFSKVVLS
jgi:hypothetical protein